MPALSFFYKRKTLLVFSVLVFIFLLIAIYSFILLPVIAYQKAPSTFLPYIIIGIILNHTIYFKQRSKHSKNSAFAISNQYTENEKLLLPIQIHCQNLNNQLDEQDTSHFPSQEGIPSYKLSKNNLTINTTVEQIVLRLNKDLVITYINHISKTIFDVAPEECIGLSFFEFIPSSDIPKTKQILALWEEHKLNSAILDTRHISRNGKTLTIIWSVRINRDEQQNTVEFSAAGLRLAEWKKIQDEWQLAHLVYQNSNEAMIITDQNMQIVGINPAFEKITGYAEAEVLNKNPTFLASEKQSDAFYEAMWYKLQTSDRWKGEIWCKKKNGDLFAAYMIITTIFNEDNTPHRRIAVLSDITDQKLSEELIWQQTHFDSLTNLPNRNFLKQEILRAKKIHHSVVLILLDLDDFKYANDTLSHDLGDRILIQTARRIQSCVQEADIVARLGGDEFAILLTENTNPTCVERLGHTLLKELSEPYNLGNDTIHLSTSIGITFYPEDATEIEDLLINADQAMYAAKRNGKNQFHYFTKSMQDAAKSRMQIINDLKLALEGKQFKMMYQPIIELKTGTINKAEALIRWEHPAKGIINPIDFISIAEDTGMITSFGNWVFHEAAQQARNWREKYHSTFQIDINISPAQFRNEGINSACWLEYLKELNLPGEGIAVEITERLLLESNEQVQEQLLALRKAGIEIALDDFGIGYSSLSYLQKFHIDYIKIDRKFVENLSKESDNLALCEAIIVMAHKLGMRVISEGIETVQQENLLKEAGCDYGQGYLYSQPLPASEFEKLLEKERPEFK